MNVKFSKDRRITIPKSFTDKYDIDVDRYYNIEYKDNKIIIDLDDKIDVDKRTTDIILNNKVDHKDSFYYKNDKPPIITNLDEGQHFSRKYYTPCKLVIRTKSKYIKSACEKCKGYLLKDSSNNLKQICPYYNKSNEIKKLNNDIKQNINKLNEKITSQIKSIGGNTADSVITFVNDDTNHKCYVCGTQFKNGFMVDKYYYCKNCLKEDLMDYISKFKKNKIKENK